MGGGHQDAVDLLIDFAVQAELVLGALHRYGSVYKVHACATRPLLGRTSSIQSGRLGGPFTQDPYVCSLQRLMR